MKKTTRRELLQLMGGAGVAAVCPLSQILNFICEGLISQAHAQENGYAPRNLIHINVGGAVQRWNYDNPMRIRGDKDPFIPNEMVSTAFTEIDREQKKVDMEYRHQKIGKYYMPHIWSQHFPIVGGGTLPMTTLLKNMLTIRGVDMEVDSHPFCNGQMVAPIPGGNSITGILGDLSPTSIPSILSTQDHYFYSAADAYKSPQGTSAVKVISSPTGPQNPLKEILASFNVDNYTSYRKDTYLKERIDKAIDSLERYATQNNISSTALFKDRKNAEELFRAGTEDLNVENFVELFDKYQSIMQQALKDQSLQDLTDREVPGLEFPFSISGKNKSAIGNLISKTGTYANRYHLEGNKVAMNKDLRSMFQTAHMDPFCKNLAIAEFLVTKGLSQSITLVTNQDYFIANLDAQVANVIKNSSIEGSAQYNEADTTVFTLDSPNIYASKEPFDPDSHLVGSIVSLMSTSLFYSGLSGCIYELTQSLKKNPSHYHKGKNLFDETIIHFASEFERAPRATGRGSDHAWEACTASYFSGAIKSHQIVGNIYDQAYLSQETRRLHYPGTWGAGAPVKGAGLNNEKILLKAGHLTSSLAAMLRVPAPSTAEKSLVYESETEGIKFLNDLEEPHNMLAPDEES